MVPTNHRRYWLLHQYRSVWFTAPFIPVRSRYVCFFRKRSGNIGTDRYSLGIRPENPVPLLFLPFLYRSFMKGPVLKRFILLRNGNVPVDGVVFWYRSSTVPYRSNTVPSLRYLNGTFEDTSVPLPFFTVPILVHCTVNKKPPMVRSNIYWCSNQQLMWLLKQK